MTSTIAKSVAMVRPKNFAFNPQTAENNAFQQELTHFTPAQVQDIATLEFNNMVAMLKAKGIKVVVFQENDNNTPDSIFPNNWFSTFTDELILYPMFTPNRRLERKPAIYKKLSNDLRKPINTKLIEREKKGEILEGTGSLVCDYVSKTAFAALSPRTTADALASFESISGYSTIRFNALGPDGNHIYHTNVMMTMADTFVVIGLDTIDTEERDRVKTKLKDLGKDIIGLSNEQVFNHFAGNLLQLQNAKGKKFLVMSSEALTSLTNEQKDIIQNKHQNEIIAVPIHLIEKIGGGSARCMMAELFYD
jgi:hypothetical protein